ncbi:type II secretion system F family protein [Sandaracinobacter sp. RS1-74]|uniref:type II secretion system F family protein n=1 Tax=Sandaracinobacteroides sayramensis TaxID=2913411 RepID=UPI001EDB0865|nr:type II secretion system F family protein [Sandaracinobacteroides sayramensis]MCG2840568.1 type II secretion system F family protein [Sandaracinobacteroides sayramensis]
MMTWLILALVFGAVVLVVLALAPLFGRKVDVAQRLSTSPRSSEVTSQPGIPSLKTDHSGSLWAKLVAQVEARGLSLEDSKSNVLAEKLALAGYEQPYAVRAYVLIRTGLTLLLPVLAYTLVTLSGASLSVSKLYMLLVVAAAAGLYVPNVIVSGRADRRKQEILNGFPDALDLMLVCVEAGLGIDACFARVGQEIVNLHPKLADLFAGVSLELRAGRARSEALKNMAKRSGVEEIQSFATLVIQSDKLGASIGQALKVYAAEMREGRRMRAEEKAHRLPVLLSIPLVLFLLPTMIGVLALPASISLRDGMFGG